MSKNGKCKCKQKIKSALEKTVREIKNAVFPPDITCDRCGAELVCDTRYNLCGECLCKLPFVGDKVCLVCGEPIQNEADYCIRCQNTESVFVKNCSPFVYEDEAKELIYAMKFGGKKYIAKTLASFMVDEYIKRNLQCEIIVFVPMSKAEKKKRGFNQSELLAYEVGDRLNIPVLPALEKRKDTSAQKELNKTDRAKNLEGAFACVFSEVSGRKILLVDDVFTTGATANECARVLLKARAKDVFVLTAAVTQKKQPIESGITGTILEQK